MAFPDHLVTSLLDFFGPTKDSIFFDPYCGSGTSLIEAQHKGLDAYGIDANPSSVLVSTVKTDWSVDIRKIRDLIVAFNRVCDHLQDSDNDPIVEYLENSGMITRGWITKSVAVRTAAIKRWIESTIHNNAIKDFFTLALITSVVRDLSNIKFGPELYCVPPSKQLPDIGLTITHRLNKMVADLETHDGPRPRARVRLGDSRDGRSMRNAAPWTNSPAFVITSPPYPTEHDYTRNSRLELVFMESVVDIDSLRRIKKKMIRSHSKGIYVGDNDAWLVRGFEPVQRIKRQVESRIEKGASGFEGQYAKVISNYFGGMIRHFDTLSHYIPPGSRLAYIVGDEASYKGVHIPTAQLLGDIIRNYVTTLNVDRIATWRPRRTLRNRTRLYEHILFITKPC